MGCGCKKVKATPAPPSYAKKPITSNATKVAPKVTIKK